MRRKMDPDAAKAATPAPAPKKDDLVLEVWSSLPEDGSGVPPGNICSTGPITIQVDNIANPEAYQYIWYRSGTALTSEKGHTLNVTESGMYQAYIDYGTICSGSANANSNIIAISIGSIGQGIAIKTPENTSLCPSSEDIETLSINITNPTWNYQWHKNGGQIAGATAATYNVNASTFDFEGEYQVEISGIGTCTELSEAIAITNAASYTVTRNNTANLIVLPYQTQTLSVSTTALSPTYQWFRNSTAIAGATNNTLDITKDGNYYASIKQSNTSCIDTETKNSKNTIALSPTSFEIITDYAYDYTACESTSTVLEITTINAIDDLGGKTNVTADLIDSFTYQWQKNGEDVIGEMSKNISLTSATENGNYTVTTSLNTYNERSSVLPVRLLTNETITIQSTGLVYCNPTDTITISTTTDLLSESFSWEKDGTAINTTDTSLNITSSGKYRLVLNKNGCTLLSNEIEISTLDTDVIQLDVDGDIVFTKGSSKTVTASGGTQYRWFDVNNTLLSSTDSMTFTEEGTFLLIANINTCEITIPINAVYEDIISIPNVITPNGDGANDQWVVPSSYAKKQGVTVTIYNNKGIELLNQTDYQNNWPQSTLSFPKQNMVFYYVIKNTSKVLKQGTITVII